MKIRPILILFALLLVTGANLRAQTRVLVLGGSQPYQSWAEAAFPPSGVATNLQGIIQGDSAVSQPVTVQSTDTYQTKTMWVSPIQKNWTFESKTLMSWFYWPNNHASTLALLANNWNYVVMMDDPHVASIFPEYHLEGVLRISQAVRQAGGTPVLAMTWSSGATPVSKFGEMAYRVGDGAGAIVAPAGYAWNNVSAGLKDAGTRPTARGAYVTAATVYSRLYNRSAKTSSYVPAGMTVADRDAIADVAMATVQTEATKAHYTGKLRRPTHFASRNGVQSLVKDRTFLYHYYQSSTENGINGGFDDFGTALPVCFSNIGVIPTHPYLQPMYTLPLYVPGPVQFCYSREFDLTNAGWFTNPEMYANYACFHFQDAYSGATTAIAGVLLMSNAAALPGYDTPGNVIFNGGAVAAQVGGSGWTTGQVDTLLANAFKTRGSLGIDTTNGDLTQWTAFTTSNFGGALGLTKVGPGTLTLNQANTYTGPTLVSGGTLVLANSLALQNCVIDTGPLTARVFPAAIVMAPVVVPAPVLFSGG